MGPEYNMYSENIENYQILQELAQKYVDEEEEYINYLVTLYEESK